MERPWHQTLALDRYLEVLWRRKWVLLAPVLLAAAGAIAVTAWMPRVYESSATVRIALVGGAANEAVEHQQAERLTNTYAYLLQSGPVLSRAATDLDLSISLGELRGRIDTEVLADTELIRITAEGGSPEEAQRLASALALALVEEGQAFYTGSANPSLAGSFSVVETALLPDSPVRPSWPLNMGIGLLAGLAAGVGLALVLEYTDATLRGVKDLTHITPLPVLGSVSQAKTPAVNGAIPAQHLEMGPNSPAWVGDHLLTANLRSLVAQQQLRSVLLTSAWPEEGTTNAAVATALALTQSGLDLLLVDANLHNPRVHTLFDLPEQPGLTHLLLSSFNGPHELRKSLAAVVQPTSSHGLTVLTSGSSTRNSEQLLASSRMRKLIEFFNSVNSLPISVTIMDAPPFLQSGYTASMAPQVSGVVLVCAEGTSSTDSVEMALEQLHNLGANVLGLVYIKTPTR